MLWYIVGFGGIVLAAIFGNKRSRRWAIKTTKKYGRRAKGAIGRAWKRRQKKQARKRKKRNEIKENKVEWGKERKVRKGSGKGPVHLCGLPTKAGTPCTQPTYYQDCGRH